MVKHFMNPSQVVTLEVTDFHLQSAWAGCDYDWLRIYDGPSSSSRLIGEYCSTTPPDLIMSSSQDLYIHFHSDDTVQYKGAHFQWYGKLRCGL